MKKYFPTRRRDISFFQHAKQNVLKSAYLNREFWTSSIKEDAQKLEKGVKEYYSLLIRRGPDDPEGDQSSTTSLIFYRD